jgi:hypothetical protein
LKATLADKNYNWKALWLSRYCIAILNWNEGYSWKLEMCKEFGFPPLDSELLDLLEKEDEDQKARKKLPIITLYKAMIMGRRQGYKESIRASDKRAAENKEIIHLSLPFAKVFGQMIQRHSKF